MNRTLLRLSTQALFGRRRGVVLLLIAGALLALAVLVRLLTDDEDGIEAVVGLGFTLALPLVALLAATAVLGPEIDDGSVVYLLAKPVSRHVIAGSKFAAAWGATMVLGALPWHSRRWCSSRRSPRRALAVGAGGRGVGTVYTAVFLGSRRAHPARRGRRPALRARVGGRARLDLRRGALAVGGCVGPRGGRRDQLAGRRGRRPRGRRTPWWPRRSSPSRAVWFTGDRLRSFTLRGDE